MVRSRTGTGSWLVAWPRPGIQQAIREIISDSTVHGLDEDGQVVFFRAPQTGATPKALPKLPRSHVPLGPGEFSYRITDEEGAAELNARQPGTLEKLLTALEVDKTERDVIVGLHRGLARPERSGPHQRRRERLLPQQPVPYRPRNGNSRTCPSCCRSRGSRRPSTTATTTSRDWSTSSRFAAGAPAININTAPKLILKASVCRTRRSATSCRRAPRNRTLRRAMTIYATRAQFTVNSATFRIESEGVIGGEPRARLVTIVQRVVGGATAPRRRRSSSTPGAHCRRRRESRKDPPKARGSGKG